MRVGVLQENLAKALSVVGRAVSSRSTMPVLGNILLEARDNQLRLAATNLEIGVNCWIGAIVEDEGAITVPARLLVDFVGNLPPERVDMELSVRTQTLHLRCLKIEANLKGIDAAEFPHIPTVGEQNGPGLMDSGDGVAIELEPGGLRRMVDQVVFAASSDDSRPTLTGVEVTFHQSRITMAATDGYRLSLRSAPVGSELPAEKMVVIVPAKSLAEFARISADADENQPVQVLVTQSRNQILFQIWGRNQEGKGGSFHRVELASQLIDARFPDYHAIIPKTHTTRTVVDTAAFLKAVRLAILFARDNANIVRLRINPANGAGSGQLSLTATSAEIGDSVNDIDAMVEGNDLEIAFNGKYLIDVLSQIEQPQVLLETTQPTRPGTIRPVGMGEDEFLHVVMPMHPSR